MAGYTRQSVADILNGENVTAPPLNAEFNSLQDAFGTGGHSHDGSAGNAPKINLQTSVSNYLMPNNGGVGGKHSTGQTSNPTQTDDVSNGYGIGSIWVNVTTNKVFQCLSNVSGAASWHELAAFNPQGHWIPTTSGVNDIGSSSYEFRDLHLYGTASAANFEGVLGANTPAQINGTVIVAGSPSIVGTNDGFYGDLFGTATGNFKGDIYSADNTTVILDNGTDGTDAQFIGSVTGNVTGNVVGDVTGNLTGNSAGTHTGPVDADSNVVSNVATPVEGTDGANKQYVLDQLSLGVNSVDQYRIDAQKLAINAEDLQYTISTGVTGYSALHYAAKAEASQIAAASSETNSGLSETAAANSALIASQKAALVSNSLDAAQGSLIGVLI